jgi:hypothetical protein
MTTEYVLEPGQTHEELAQELLAQAASPYQVHWSPRPDVYGGGVYVLADEGIAQRTREAMQARRAEEAQRIADAQKAADERDSQEDVASGLLTPAEAGFSANAGTDPGSAGEAERNAAATADEEPVADDEDGDEADEEPVADDPATPGDESKMTPAQRRAAARRAKQEAAAQASPTEEKSE